MGGSVIGKRWGCSRSSGTNIFGWDKTCSIFLKIKFQENTRKLSKKWKLAIVYFKNKNKV